MIEDITRFITIVDTGSITRAASLLHMTQPALSLAVKRLEKELDKQLISHKKKHLTITPDGKKFYVRAKKIAELWSQAKTSSPILSKVTIGLFDNAALRLASYFHKQLQQHNHFSITIDRSSNLIRDLSLGIVDIAIVVSDNKTSLPPTLSTVYSFEEELIPVINKKSTSESSKLPFILYNVGSYTRQYIDETFHTNHMTPTVIAESSSTSFMKELALTGAGIALLPFAVVKNELQEKKLYQQPFPFRFFRTIAILTNGNQDTKKILEEIIFLLRK